MRGAIPAARGARARGSRSPAPSRCGRSGCVGAGGGLEQLDQVAVGVGEQRLAPAGAGDQVAAEGEARAAKPGEFGVEVVDDELDAVAARGGGIVRGGTGA